MIASQRAPMYGRTAPTIWQIANPIWLAGDACRPSRWGWWAHFMRNPFYNLKAVVLGVSHLPRVVVATHSAWTLAESGWNAGWTIAHGWRGMLPLPFVSYRGTRWEWVIGWKTSGGLATTLRRANSANQEEEP